MANAAIAGIISGSRILKKIGTWPAPSTRAASKSSLGSSLMKLCSRKIARGRAKMVCAIQIGQNVPAMPASTKIFSSGIRVTWIGTICRANTTMNSAAAPGTGSTRRRRPPGRRSRSG